LITVGDFELPDENTSLDIIITRVNGVVEAYLPHRGGRITGQVPLKSRHPFIMGIVDIFYVDDIISTIDIVDIVDFVSIIDINTINNTVNIPGMNPVSANHAPIPSPNPRNIRPINNITPATKHPPDANITGFVDDVPNTPQNTRILQVAMRIKHSF